MSLPACIIACYGDKPVFTLGGENGAKQVVLEEDVQDAQCVEEDGWVVLESKQAPEAKKAEADLLARNQANGSFILHWLRQLIGLRRRPAIVAPAVNVSKDGCAEDGWELVEPATATLPD